MIKIDFKKELKQLYGPSKKEFTVIDVPSLQYLMVDGHGDPNVSQEYQDALETLYAVAYTIKFASKKELEKDYIVPPLEGLWWAEDMAAFTIGRDKSQWDWTAMIMQPDWITQEMFANACATVKKKKNPAACPNYGWKATLKDCRCKSCTLVPTMTKHPLCTSCTTNSCLPMATLSTASITKSISAIRAASPQTS